MYTIYNVTRGQDKSHDVVWFKPDGTVASVWTGDGVHCGEFGLTQSNFITKTIVRATVFATVLIDKLLA
jgi:hypothetical protein